MACNVTWTCDNCNKSVTVPNATELTGFHELRIESQQIGGRLYTNSWMLIKKAQWCEDCLRKRGIRFNYSEPVPEKPPTVEDLVRQIVTEEIEVALPRSS